MGARTKKLGRKEAIRAMCFKCCGDMRDGLIDCCIASCPLYTWQPFKKCDPDLAWRQDGAHLKKNRAALAERAKRGAGKPKGEKHE